MSLLHLGIRKTPRMRHALTSGKDAQSGTAEPQTQVPVSCETSFAKVSRVTGAVQNSAGKCLSLRWTPNYPFCRLLFSSNVSIVRWLQTSALVNCFGSSTPYLLGSYRRETICFIAGMTTADCLKIDGGRPPAYGRAADTCMHLASCTMPGTSTGELKP